VKRTLDTAPYRLLLLAFPRRFRRRHGAQLLMLYRDMCAPAAREGGFRLWRKVAADAVVEGLAARWEQFRRSLRRGSRPRRRSSSPPFGSPKGSPSMYLEQIWQDLRIAARGLARSPGFAAVAILTLGLSIGANTAIFGLVNAVLLRPLPFPEPQQLVRIYGTDLEEGDRYGQVSLPDIIDLRAQSRSFAAISMVDSREPILMSEGGAERVTMRYVHAGYFPLLGVEPALGRLFTAGEEGPESSLVVVITDGLWRRAFGGDPTVIDRPVVLDGRPFRIIGVLPAWYDDVRLDFEGEEAQIYRPWPLVTEDSYRSGRSMVAIGRLAPGVSVREAQSEVDAIYAGLIELYPDDDTGNGLALVPLRDALVGAARPALLMLWGAVGMVLLIGCVNLANLLLARAAGRSREVAVRAALGAGRGRIVRQLLAESLLIGLTGGVLGIVFAALGVKVLLVLAGDIVPRVRDVPVDPAMVGFAALLALLTAMLFGLAPALRAGATGGPAQALEGDGRGATAGRRGRRSRNALVVAEVALAVVLLAGAGLFARSFANLLRVDSGVDADGVLTTTLYPVWRHYADADGDLPDGAIEGLYREILDHVVARPGVVAAGVTSILPMNKSFSCDGFWPDDRPMPPAGEIPCAETRVVLGDYLATMGIRILQGRALDPRDRADGQPVALINEALAKRYWPGQDAVGKSIISVHGAMPREVVGIVEDVHEFGPAQAAPLQIYIAYPQDPWGVISMTLAVRGSGSPATIRDAVREVDPDIAVDDIVPMGEVVSGSISAERFRTLLLGLFAGTAVLLAVIGLYGVLATIVASRSREMGIRAALGARPAGLFALVVGEGMGLAALGLAAGLLAALAAGRFFTGFLFEITPVDSVTYLGVAALVLAVAFAASALPARRATRIDPCEALRRS
jgi:putative ABC transport system permease protein